MFLSSVRRNKVYKTSSFRHTTVVGLFGFKVYKQKDKRNRKRNFVVIEKHQDITKLNIFIQFHLFEHATLGNAYTKK